MTAEQSRQQSNFFEDLRRFNEAERQRKEAEEARQKAQAERRERINQQVREREIADLRFQVQQNKAWQTGVQRAVRNNIADQYRQTLMGELDAMIDPPQPQPEPESLTEIVYTSHDEAGSPHLGDRDFNPKLWTKI